MMRTLSSVFAVLVALSLAATTYADPLDLYYTKSAVSGHFQYDFKLVVTNTDSSYAPGQGWNWITFGDVSGSTSTLPDFSLISQTFPNPNMQFTFSSGGHNGPTFLDVVNLSTNGWIPLGIGDFVQWSGNSAFDVPDGNLLFSTLIPVNGATPADFKPAIPLSAVPEPSVALLVGFVVLAADQGRRRLARRKRSKRVRKVAP